MLSDCDRKLEVTSEEVKNLVRARRWLFKLGSEGYEKLPGDRVLVSGIEKGLKFS